MIRSSLRVLILASVIGTTAQAQVTYKYTALNWNVFQQTNPAFEYNSSEHMTAWFTVPTVVAANTGHDYNQQLVTWRIDDGFTNQFGGTGLVNLFEPDAYNSPFPTTLTYLYLHADANGNIDFWDFDGFNAPHAGAARSNYPNNSDVVNNIFVHDYAYVRPGSVGGDGVDIARAGRAETGAWTIDPEDTVTPEPATLSLLALGLCAMGLVRQRAGNAQTS